MLAEDAALVVSSSHGYHALARSNAATAFPTGCVLVLADEDSGPFAGPRFAAWRALQRAGLWPQRTAAAAVTAVALH